MPTLAKRSRYACTAISVRAPSPDNSLEKLSRSGGPMNPSNSESGGAGSPNVDSPCLMQAMIPSRGFVNVPSRSNRMFTCLAAAW